jgi:cytochrome c oxidase assembly factor CtaG
MTGVSLAALQSWSIPPAATFAIALVTVVYLRGWWLLRRAGSRVIPSWRLLSFYLGMFGLWVALASPMDVFNGFLLTAHMLQHMLLMMVVPPLILLGSPLIPLLRGLPIFAAREFGGPFLNWTVAQKVGRTLTHPATALLLMGITMFAWHVPSLYELALASSAWHEVEHASFLAVSMIFWWPVIEPWPGHRTWARWSMVPYLLIADLQNTILSAILVFSDRVLYPSYSSAPRLFGLSALQDQIAAGAMMWVVGSLAFVVPAAFIAIHYLSPKARVVEAPLLSASRRFHVEFVDAAHERISSVNVWLHSRIRGIALEAVWFAMLFVVFGLCMLRLANSSEHEEKALCFQGKSGAFAVSVYAPHKQVAVGETEFEILVQDSVTNSVLLDAPVQLSAHAADNLKFSTNVDTSEQDSTNKLMQAAKIHLPAVGDWILRLDLRSASERAEFLFPMKVEQQVHEHEIPWPFVVFAGSGMGLFLIHTYRHHSSMTNHTFSEGDPTLVDATKDE